MADTDAELARRFGRAVFDARRLRVWSQEELAGRLGVSTTHVGFLERGERMPSVGLLVQAARILDLSLDSVLVRATGHARRDDELSALAAAVPVGLRPHALALLRSLTREPIPARGSSRMPASKRRRGRQP